MPTNYPRILLANSSAFNLYSGGGITLTNLFQGWPSDRIAVVHSDSIPTDSSVCRQFYRLGHAEREWMWPLSILSPLMWGPKNPESERKTARVSGSGGDPDSASHSRFKNFARYGLDLLGGTNLLAHVRMSDSLKTWIQEFKPEIVYSQLGDLFYIRLTQQLASLFNIPIAFHIMDDWPEVIYRRGLLAPFLRRQMQKEFKDLIGQSSMRLGICESMCKAYELRYGYPFMAFHNALDISPWQEGVLPNNNLHSPVRLVYSGSIASDTQLESLYDVCDAVAALSAAGLNVKMRIHSPAFYADRYRACLERPQSVVMCDPPEQHTLVSLFTDADILVLPINFDKASVQYIRYSMPTKVPAFMMSGTPVLVYGPPEAAAVEYAAQGEWGYVVKKRGVLGVQEAIRNLIGDQAMRDQLGRRARELAFRNHNAAEVRPAFARALAAVAPILK